MENPSKINQIPFIQKKQIIPTKKFNYNDKYKNITSNECSIQFVKITKMKLF